MKFYQTNAFSITTPNPASIFQLEGVYWITILFIDTEILSPNFVVIFRYISKFYNRKSDGNLYMQAITVFRSFED